MAKAVKHDNGIIVVSAPKLKAKAVRRSRALGINLSDFVRQAVNNELNRA